MDAQKYATYKSIFLASLTVQIETFEDMSASQVIPRISCAFSILKTGIGL
jgi:hypothetical protein